MIRAIVFDCFGVLVGSSFAEVYRASGGDPRKDNAFIEELLGKANAGLITGEELIALAAAQLATTPASFAANLARMEQPNEDLFTYIRQELKPQYMLAMLSNAEAGGPQRHLSKAQLALFDGIFVSGEIGYAKPDRAAFQLVADKLGIAFDEFIFVDDLERYVLPAREMGIISIQFTDLASFKQQLAAALTQST